MKRYKPLLIQIGILLLFISLMLFINERQKKFITIDFSQRYDTNRTIELAGFEEGEQWRGNFSYDSQRVLQGKSSITFSSWYGLKNILSNDVVVTLKNGYSKGYVNLFILDKKNLSSIDSFQLVLSETTTKQSEYDLKPLLHTGWNRVPVVIPEWQKITHLSFAITSKPGEIAEVNLDRFWIENTSAYSSDVLTSKSQSMSLRTIGERTYLSLASPLVELYGLSVPPLIQKGVITVSLIPEHAKEIGLSMNGTAMKIAGKSMNECILYKNDAITTTKLLQTASGKDDMYVFLKAEVQSKKITYFISNNGVDFEACGSVITSGKKSIELSVQGSYLIDSYLAEY